MTIRVVVGEDSAVVREGIRRMLERSEDIEVAATAGDAATLRAAIAEHRPDVVLHGHTHAGRFEGAIGDVPVFNVAVPVLGRDFFVFELDGATVRAAA